MSAALSIINALAPLGLKALAGCRGRGAKDQKTRIAFAVALMRILACLRPGGRSGSIATSEQLTDHGKASGLCISYSVALGPKGSEDRKLILEAYEQTKTVKEPESGDEEIIAAL